MTRGHLFWKHHASCDRLKEISQSTHCTATYSLIEQNSTLEVKCAEVSKQGSSPQTGMKKGFDEGFVICTPHSNASSERAFSVLKEGYTDNGQNWQTTQFVPVWHWNSMWTDVVESLHWWPCPSTGKEGHPHQPIIRLIVLRHTDRSEGQTRFKNYKIKPVVIYQGHRSLGLATDSCFVNSLASN